jgi:hypothetical protein
MPIDSSRSLAAFAAALLLVPLASLHAAGLNDTGQTLCYDATNAAVACSAAVGGDAGVNPRQDARYGRDAQAAGGTLTKTGAGAAGFDYTKIANNGSTLAASVALGTNPTDWACTKDNVTGLVWEVKTTSGLRHMNHRFAWYSTNPTTNGGDAGNRGTDTCGGTLAAAPYNNQCNTQNYVAAVNAATLCGASDWRLPTRRELLTLAHAGVNDPSIDATFFPNTNATDLTATNSTYFGDSTLVWVVSFLTGTSILFLDKSSSSGHLVRLVRGGQ